LLRELVVPRGEGLTGWVAEQRRPILNGDPSADKGYPLSATPALRSALAIPVTAPDGAEAVLTLYRNEAEAFDNADFSALCAVCRRAGFRLGDKPKPYRVGPGSSPESSQPMERKPAISA
jgi:GAF domain-containing protein